MLSIQAQEEMDYEVGAYRNEFQAAYALSRLEQGSGDRAKIDGLVLAGAYVVVAWVNQYCSITDASLPPLPYLRRWYLTREEAEFEIADLAARDAEDGDCDGEVRYVVEPQLKGTR